MEQNKSSREIAPQPGMRVEATDGPLGVVESLRAVVPRAGETGEELVVADDVGRYRRLLPATVHSVEDNVVQLNIPGAALPVLDLANAAPARDAHDGAAHDGNVNGVTGTLDGERATLALHEERLDVRTHVVELGRARVRKVVEERAAQAAVDLRYQEVQVDRVPRDDIVEAPLEPYMDGETLVVPVVEEEIVEVVVERRYRLKEELRITRRVLQHEHTIDVPLRAERVDISEEWNNAPRDPAALDNDPTRA